MKQKTSTDDLPQHLFELLRLIKREFACEQLPVPSWLHLETLRFVAEAKAPGMHEIATYLRVTAPTTTALVNLLVKEGFLERVDDASDRRRVAVKITTKGKACLKEAAKKRERVFARVIAPLSQTERVSLDRIISSIIKIS